MQEMADLETIDISDDSVVVLKHHGSYMQQNRDLQRTDKQGYAQSFQVHTPKHTHTRTHAHTHTHARHCLTMTRVHRNHGWFRVWGEGCARLHRIDGCHCFGDLGVPLQPKLD